jgi:hypothetical protein
VLDVLDEGEEVRVAVRMVSEYNEGRLGDMELYVASKYSVLRLFDGETCEDLTGEGGGGKKLATGSSDNGLRIRPTLIGSTSEEDAEELALSSVAHLLGEVGMTDLGLHELLIIVLE